MHYLKEMITGLTNTNSSEVTVIICYAVKIQTVFFETKEKLNCFSVKKGHEWSTSTCSLFISFRLTVSLKKILVIISAFLHPTKFFLVL